MYGMFSDLCNFNLLLLFLVIFLLLFLLRSIFSATFLSLRSLWISGLCAGSFSEPLWKSGLCSLGPFCVLVFPHRLQPFCPENLSSSLVQLLSFSVCSCVCPPLIFGEHVYPWRMSTTESLRIKTLLDSFVSHLKLLPLLQLLHFIILVKLSLLIVIFVCFKSNYAFPDPLGLSFQFI